MKASDTVLKPKDLIRLEESRETNTDIEASLIKQAEVSFNAGIQAWRNTLLQKKKKKGGKDIASHCNKGTKRDATGGLNETTM